MTDYLWIGSEECLRVLHPACGCGEFRLDVRSPVRVETQIDGAA